MFGFYTKSYAIKWKSLPACIPASVFILSDWILLIMSIRLVLVYSALQLTSSLLPLSSATRNVSRSVLYFSGENVHITPV